MCQKYSTSCIAAQMRAAQREVAWDSHWSNESLRFTMGKSMCAVARPNHAGLCSLSACLCREKASLHKLIIWYHQPMSRKSWFFLALTFLPFLVGIIVSLLVQGFWNPVPV